uniref:extensin n=1 Tax=Erigeron canadensis TaxID=72917 RepID=UPI001CB98E53|nr:extensin [Erigeron canadensis]
MCIYADTVTEHELEHEDRELHVTNVSLCICHFFLSCLRLTIMHVPELTLSFLCIQISSNVDNDDVYVCADVRLHGASTLLLTSTRKYHVVNRLADDILLPPVDPLTPVLPEAYCANPPGYPPPSSTTLPPPVSGPPSTGSYFPSPPASSSSNPTPPASSSSSYPTYPTPPASSSSSYPTPPASSSSYPTPPASSSSYPTPPASSSSYPTPPFSSSIPTTPPSDTIPDSPAVYEPGSPAIYQPGPGFSPPYNDGPSPPTFSFPSPTGFIPAPPLFEPPVVYPPPNGPPPAHTEPESALWCVAKPSVPDPIIQEAMNYACGSGADCESLQPNGECFQPDTLFAHASYAFNSYWQRTKVAGGTCEFGGSAMLVTVDPSYDGCHFIYF